MWIIWSHREQWDYPLWWHWAYIWHSMDPLTMAFWYPIHQRIKGSRPTYRRKGLNHFVLMATDFAPTLQDYCTGSEAIVSPQFPYFSMHESWYKSIQWLRFMWIIFTMILRLILSTVFMAHIEMWTMSKTFDTCLIKHIIPADRCLTPCIKTQACAMVAPLNNKHPSRTFWHCAVRQRY